tara:strand:+ start:16 stop:1587 length:1572 start_codon:yes stop_codon:yes gene_type:complete
MKDYRQFLNENLSTDELTPNDQFYTEFISWLSSQGYASFVDPDEPTKNYSEVPMSGISTKIVVTEMKSSERPQAKKSVISFVEDYFKTSDGEGDWKDLISGTMGKIRIGIDKSGLVKDNKPQTIDIFFKSLKATIDVQEVMTAALVLLGTIYSEPNIPLEKCDKILALVEGKVGEVEGQNVKKDKRKEIKEGIKMNYIDLAPSISSSNAILKEMDKVTPTKAYWTGQAWHKDIKLFNPDEAEKTFKNYNPSDIVIKGSNGNYYGFSLKKKKTETSNNPTLLNKPAIGEDSMLKNILDPEELQVIEDARVTFFRNVLINNAKTSKEKSALKKMKTWKEVVEEVREAPKSIFTSAIKSNENQESHFYKTIADAVPNNGKEFMKGFFDMAFRTKLKKLVPNNQTVDDVVTELSEGRFDFWLNTGIGTKYKDSIRVKPATMLDLDTTISVISDLLSNEELTVELSKSKTQAFNIKKGEKGAAKIFFTISLAGKVLVNIEVRYKGPYTPAPQFQAYTTSAFTALFKGV